MTNEQAVQMCTNKYGRDCFVCFEPSTNYTQNPYSLRYWRETSAGWKSQYVLFESTSWESLFAYADGVIAAQGMEKTIEDYANPV